MDHQTYARHYVWNRFKYSALTLAGLLLPSLSSLAMMLSEWPLNLQLLNIVALVAMLGISYWWHWFYQVEILVREGVLEFMQNEERIRHHTLMQAFDALDLSSHPMYNALKNDLMERYDAFMHALTQQKIISNTSRNHFQTKAAQAFESGIALLTEIGDILVVQTSVDIGRIKEQLMDPPHDTDKERLIKVFEAYRQNESKLQRLADSLRALNHSYVLGVSHLAALTSKTHEKEDFEALELQEAIDAAKVVQEKLHRYSPYQNHDLQAVQARYSSQSKE